MPYIKANRRNLEYYNFELGGQSILLEPENAGELNFLFTRIASEYLLKEGLNYQAINDVIGALEGAKLELYRRIAAPYEDKKIIENGDVYNKEILS